MTIFSRRGLLVVVALAVVLPAVARAQVLGTGNVSTESTQVMNNVALVTQIGTQVQQLVALQQQIKQLGSADWGQGSTQLQQYNDAVGRASAIAYNARNLDQQWAQLYPGYQGFVDGRLGPGGFQQKYAELSERLDGSLRGLLKAAGLQTQGMQQEQMTRARLQGFSQGAVGELQAQQATNQFLGQTNDSLDKMRQLMMSQMQLQTEWYSHQKALADAKAAADKKFNTPQVRVNYTTSEGF